MLARSCLTIAALALCCTHASAQQPFYAGKQLTILVNYDAGGPTDLEARVLSRHIGRHIRRQSAHHRAEHGRRRRHRRHQISRRDRAPRRHDAGILHRLDASALSATPERFNVDFRTYEFIAVLPSGRIHFMRTDVRPGIKRAADVIKGENIVVGGLQRDGPKDMAMRLTLDMLGARYSYVTGYNSSAQAMIALQRGEISYYADSPPLYKTKIEPQVKAGTLIPVFYDPDFDGKDFSVPAYMKDYAIPPFHELYKSIKGAMPSGPALGGVQVHPAGQRHHVPDAGVAAGRAARCGQRAARRGREARGRQGLHRRSDQGDGRRPGIRDQRHAQRRCPRRADDQPGAQGVHGRLWQAGGEDSQRSHT